MIEKDKNKEFFKLLEDVNIFSHAYLFETNSIKDAYPFILRFAKKILCDNHYLNQDKCGECNICHLIDEGSFSDFYLINPDTIGINKEEIDKLFKAFQSKSLKENGRRVYVIYGVERLDEYVSNKILKFLEEPSDNIHALLITENPNKLLSTIKSRCQNIKIRVNNVDVSQEKKEIITNFLDYLFKNGNKTIAYTNELWFNYFDERKDYEEAFFLIEKVLLDEINIRYKNENKFFNNISLDNLLKVVLIADKLSKIINNNVNLNLLVDRFIIEVTKEVK